MKINNLSIAFLTAGLINLGLGIFVFTKGKRKLSNRIFTFFLLHLFIWCIISFFIASVQDIKLAELLVRTVFAFASFIPSFFFIFAVTLGEERFPKKELRKVLLFYILSIMNTLISFSPNFIIDIEISSPFYGGNIKSGPIVKYGKPEMTVFTLNILILLFYSLYYLYKKKKEKSGIISLEIQYVFLGFLFGAIYNIFVSVFPTLFGISIADRVGPFATVIMSSIIVYGIAKYRIMDIYFVYEMFLLYFFLFACLFFIYFSCFVILNKILIFFALDPGIFPLLISGLTVAILFNPLKEKLRNFLRIKILKYDIELFTQKVFETLFSTPDVKIAFKNLTELLKSFLNVPEKILFVMKDERFFPFEKQSLPENVEIRFEKDLSIYELLERNKIVIKEEEKRVKDIYPEKEKILNEFEKFESAIGTGIFQRDNIIGGLFLKDKLDNNIFTYRDQLLLINLGYQLGIAIENLKLSHTVSEISSYIKSLLDNSPYGIVSFDKDGKTTLWNLQMEKIIEKEKMRGKHFKDFLPEEIIPVVEKKIKTFDRNIEIKEIILSKDGEKRIFRITVAPFFDEKNEFLGVQVIFSDITRIKQLEQEIAHKEKLASLGVMAAGLAHEIKNPLVTVKTFADLFPVKYEDPEFRMTYSKILVEEVERLNNLVEQVLTFARPEILKIKDVNLVEIINSSIEVLNLQFKDKKVKILKNLPQKDVIIKGDEEKLKEVFLNVLTNSFEAINTKEGIIEIDLKENSEKIEIMIADNGCGIKREIMNKIFDPFFTTKEKGTGLGLSIVLRLVEQHKGKIWIESEENKGTKVFIEFSKREKLNEVSDSSNQ